MTSPPDASGPGGAPLRLDGLQRDVLLPQVEAFLEAAQEAPAREAYSGLKDGIERMEVAPELAGRLGAILEVVLASGRVRQLFGPGAELSLTALFQQTPQGVEIAESVRALNAALEKLKGEPLGEASAAVRGPGAYALTLRTATCQLVVRFERNGVRVESVEVALA